MKLEDIYFNHSIRDYALKLTSDKGEAEELVSLAFEICLTKSNVTEGFFCRVMRNQWLKQRNKPDFYFNNESSDYTRVEEVLSRMNHYYSNILLAVSNGESLTQIHKGESGCILNINPSANTLSVLFIWHKVNLFF